MRYGRHFPPSHDELIRMGRKDPVRTIEHWLEARFIREIVLPAVSIKPDLLGWVGDRGGFRDDPEIALAAVRGCGTALRDVGPRGRDNADVVTEAVSKDGRALKYASDRFRRSRGFVMWALQMDACALEGASADLQDNYDVVMAAVSKDGYALQWASWRLRDRRDIVLAAVASGGSDALKFASKRLRGDRAIVEAAIEADPRSIRYASVELRCNYDLILRSIRMACTSLLDPEMIDGETWWAGDYCPQDLVAQARSQVEAEVAEAAAAARAAAPPEPTREEWLEAVRQDPGLFWQLPNDLQADPEFARILLAVDGQLLLRLDPKFREDRDLVLTAVGQAGLALLAFLPPNLQADAEILAAGDAADQRRWAEGRQGKA